MTIKDKLAVMLNRKGQYQLCQQTVSMNLSLEGWAYICQQLSPTVTPIFFKRRTRAVQYCDLSLVSKSSVEDLVMLRFCY
jgi:hypothetical protein